ncbi:MAG: hypothetical protein Q8P38_12035 [Candidatus Nanopelagicales bacterium]|nr:hypothetical protein [Candidatus Nanopelagicales bacterium]
MLGIENPKFLINSEAPHYRGLGLVVQLPWDLLFPVTGIVAPS